MIHYFCNECHNPVDLRLDKMEENRNLLECGACGHLSSKGELFDWDDQEPEIDLATLADQEDESRREG